ncbi:MAG: hypothetical protein AAFU83_04335, partial [Bacteroidota bacterium]
MAEEEEEVMASTNNRETIIKGISLQVVTSKKTTIGPPETKAAGEVAAAMEEEATQIEVEATIEVITKVTSP